MVISVMSNIDSLLCGYHNTADCKTQQGEIVMKKKKDVEQTSHMTPLLGPFRNIGISLTDPMGSYTGIPISPDEIPVQDVDDL